jgi:hypothetical protein
MSRSLRLLAVLAMGIALIAAISGIAIALPPPSTTIENQNDRGTVSPLSKEAWRSRKAVERFRSEERNFVPDPDIIGHSAAPPQARPVPADRPVPAAPQPGTGVVVSLLLGLVGGVIGGCAVLAGLAATTRRRPRQPASAT